MSLDRLEERLVLTPAPTTLAMSAAMGTYGGTATVTANLSSFGTPVAGESVNLHIGATNLGPVVTNTNGDATIPAASLAFINAGTYTGDVTASFAGDANFDPSSGSNDLTVTRAPLTITADPATKTYGATKTFAGTEFTTSTLYNGDTVTAATLTSAGASPTATVAGSPYAIVPGAAVGTGLGNYTITYINGNLAVTPASLTITADPATKTYATTQTFAGTEFTTSTLYNGDTVTAATLTSAGASPTATVAGSPYAIVPGAAVGTGLGNYTITYTNGNLAVTPASLTITADPATKTYATTQTFAGTEFTTSTLYNGDTVTAATLTSAGASAMATVAGSPYAIVPGAAVGTGLGNYTITYTNGNLSVTPAPLTITADDQTKTYGATQTFAGTEFTTSTLFNDDTVTAATLTSAGASAMATVAGSPYAIVPGAAVGTGLGNYTITYTNGNLSVTPAPLTITAATAFKVYGQANPAFDSTYSGFVLDEGPEALSGTLAYSTQATAASHFGLYPVTPGGLTSSDYAIQYVAGGLAVTPAPLTITANAFGKTYGQDVPTISASYSGFVNDDTPASLAGSLGSYTPMTAASHVGYYPVIVGGQASLDYTITYNSGVSAVFPAILTATPSSPLAIVGHAAAGHHGELQRLRQRRHGREPADSVRRSDDRDALRRPGVLPDVRPGRQLLRLRHQPRLRQPHARIRPGPGRLRDHALRADPRPGPRARRTRLLDRQPQPGDGGGRGGYADLCVAGGRQLSGQSSGADSQPGRCVHQRRASPTGLHAGLRPSSSGSSHNSRAGRFLARRSDPRSCSIEFRGNRPGSIGAECSSTCQARA